MPDSDEQIDTVLFLKRAISNLTASFGGSEPSIKSALMYPLRGCHLFSETLHYTTLLLFTPQLRWKAARWCLLKKAQLVFSRAPCSVL